MPFDFNQKRTETSQHNDFSIVNKINMDYFLPEGLH